MEGLDHLAAALIDGAPDGILVSQRGVVLFSNQAAATLLGYPSAEALVGASLVSMLEPEDAREMERRTRLMLQTGERFPQRVYRANRRGGGSTLAEITSRPFEWKGEPAVIAFARDVSDRVRAQAQLAMTDRLAALGTLAAGVAHEINNPMTTVLIGLQAVQRVVDRVLPPLAAPSKERSELTRLLGDLEASALRVVEIVRDLRRFSHAGDEVRTPVCLSQVLVSAERLVAHALTGTVKLSCRHGPAPKVLGVAARLEQVAVNLMLNAAQAIPEQQAGLVEVQPFVAADGRAGFEVKDNGSGISPEHLPHIFEPFFTTKPVGIGTGLGLAISHAIVTDLGGEIHVESVVGAGTTFRVLLPQCSA